MEYISVEEFLKQNGKVQEVFQDWFIEQFEKSNDFDLFNYNGEDLCYKNILDRNCDFNVEDCIPLLTEGQLRKFIEDKTGHTVTIEFYKENGYDINLEDGKDIKTSYEDLGHDLLQAYWKVAVDIAKQC